jgi:hypothetical protein
VSDDEQALSDRLQGVADALVVRIATILATEVKVRLTPAALDEIRHWVGVCARGAALEGARTAGATLRDLLPVPKVGRAMAQEMAATRLRDTPETPITPNNAPRRLPGGV